MKTIFLTAVTFFLIQTLVYGQQEATTTDGKKVFLYENGTWKYADSVPAFAPASAFINGLEIPKTKAKDIVVKHAGYSLLFSDKHKQAIWVAYELTKDETTKLYDRTDKFMVDPLVKTGSATDKDYEGSGFDRGHLAPAADMGWSSASVAESFYYSNMSPQLPAFNRGVWKRLEELVRSWAIEDLTIDVVTGPVLSNGLLTIGPNKVSVPHYYYKVILDYTEPGINGIGFILPNAGSSEPLQNFAVTIDSVEKLTGIDFFPKLPDIQERVIEKTLCLSCWTWKSTVTGQHSGSPKPVSTTAQCKGNTKAGDHCKNKTSDASGYCYLHQAQLNQGQAQSTQTIPPVSNKKSTSVQCSGTTKAGNRCKHMTYSPNGSCYQHGGN
jgi:endonuclease G